MIYASNPYYDNWLAHHGIKGQKWGVRRFQNEDGSLTPEGQKRYGVDHVSKLSNDQLRDMERSEKGLRNLDIRRERGDKLRAEGHSAHEQKKLLIGREVAIGLLTVTAGAIAYKTIAEHGGSEFGADIALRLISTAGTAAAAVTAVKGAKNIRDINTSRGNRATQERKILGQSRRG